MVVVQTGGWTQLGSLRGSLMLLGSLPLCGCGTVVLTRRRGSTGGPYARWFADIC